MFCNNFLHLSIKKVTKLTHNHVFFLFQFVETFTLDVNDHGSKRLKLSIYDAENLTSKDLHKHQFIGSIETSLEAIVDCGEEDIFRKEIFSENRKTRRGIIFITAANVDEISTKTQISMIISATKLSKKGINLFGKCDTFFEINRQLNNEDFHPVYRSEVIFRNSEPR